MIAITVQEEDDAFDIFETLNDRGLRLSVPDLVINLLLKRCRDKKSMQNVRKIWNSVIMLMGKRDISRFLRHMWISKYGDLKARGLFAEIKSDIEKSDKISLDFANLCYDESETYLSLLDIKENNIPKKCINEIRGLIKYFGVYNSLPLLLSGKKCLTDNDFVKLVKLITSLYIRHTLIANKNPSVLESAFYEASRELRAQRNTHANSKNCFNAAKRVLVIHNPSDSIVKEGCEDLYLTKQTAFWIISRIANGKQSKTNEIDIDSVNVSLEHIFPQNAGAQWPNRIDLEPFIWHIGNLTLLSEKLNSKAQNSSFKNKKDNYYCKSEIDLTKEICKYPVWNPDQIVKRATELSILLVDVWE